MRRTSVIHFLAFRWGLALLSIQSFVVSDIEAQFRYLTIYANGDVWLLVTDPEGRRLGYDPRSNQHFEEIPRGNVGAAGIDIVTDKGGEADSSQVNPVEAMIPEPLDGDYVIRAFGNSLRFFDMSIMAEHSTDPITNIANGGIIDSGQTATFVFTYDFNDRSKSRIRRVIVMSTLRQDLDNCFKLKLLGNKPLYTNWSHRVDKFEKELSEGDSLKARHELEKFEREIKRVREQTIKREERKQKLPPRFITADAFQILREDVQALLNQLPLKKKGEKDDDEEDR